MDPITGKELLRLDNISKSFGDKRVLCDISLKVYEGQSIAVTGKSGSGKTTLLSIMGALDMPDSGEVCFCGKRLTGAYGRLFRRKYAGFIFQDSCLIDEYTAYQNVQTAIRLSGSDEDPMRYLEAAGVGDRAFAYPEKLSGGEARRVSLARALAKKPRLLLLDEPTQGLDPETGGTIMRLIVEQCEKTGMTAVMVTHTEEYAALMPVCMRLENGSLNREA